MDRQSRDSDLIEEKITDGIMGAHTIGNQF